MSKSLKLRSIERNKKLKEKHLQGDLTFKELNSLIVLQKQRGHDFKKEALQKASSDSQTNSTNLKSDFLIHGHCRCCLRKFFPNEWRIKITPTHADRFKELTTVNLSLQSTYPQYICELCDLDLLNFSSLRKSLISKQERLDRQSLSRAACVGEDIKKLTYKQTKALNVETEPFEIANTTFVKSKNGFEESFLLVSPQVSSSIESSLPECSAEFLDDFNIKKEPELIIDESIDYEPSGADSKSPHCFEMTEPVQLRTHIATSHEIDQKTTSAICSAQTNDALKDDQSQKRSEKFKKAFEKQESHRKFCFHCKNFFWNLKEHLMNVAKESNPSEVSNSKRLYSSPVESPVSCSLKMSKKLSGIS